MSAKGLEKTFSIYKVREEAVMNRALSGSLRVYLIY